MGHCINFTLLISDFNFSISTPQNRNTAHEWESDAMECGKNAISLKGFSIHLPNVKNDEKCSVQKMCS